MIMACSAGEQVCSYSSPQQFFESRARCEFVGNVVGGGMLATPIGRFENGRVTVSCQPLVEPMTVSEARLDRR